MKNFFELIITVIIGLMFLLIFVFFSEDAMYKNEAIHIRNKINELIEINDGYTSEVENIVSSMDDNKNYIIEINVSKYGILDYKEKLEYDVILHYKRNMFFNTKEATYKISGYYFQIYD